MTDVRILLIGKTGTGKSSTGNMILGKRVFKKGVSLSSVSSECGSFSAIQSYQNRKFRVTVVDSPGPFDSEGTFENMNDVFVEAISLSSPGFHVIMLVLKNDRFTQQDEETLNLYLDFFGEKLFSHLILAFTHRDAIENEMSFDEFLNTLKNDKFDEIKSKCQNRVICFDNFSQEREQLDKFFGLVHEILELNNGQCYSDHHFESVEGVLKNQRKSLRKSKRKQKAVDVVKNLKQKGKLPDKTLEQIEKRISEGMEVAKPDKMLSAFSVDIINDALQDVEKEVENEIREEIVQHKGIFAMLRKKLFSSASKKGSLIKVAPSTATKSDKG